MARLVLVPGMGTSRRILYVVTFDAAEAAITWQVARLARAWHSPVVLLGARRRSRWKFARDRGAEEVGRRLGAVAASLKGHAADIHVTEDPLPDAAMRLADEIGAELIAIGAGERATREPTFIAPDALRIARESREDVLVCKPFADPNLAHVLCAADTTPNAGDAVLRAAEISRRFNALMRIVSVMPEPMWTSASDDAEDDVRRRHEAQKAFLDQFDLRGVPLSRSVVWSRNAAVEVLDEAGRYGEGLLVIGASSRAPLPQGQLGPTSDAIASACPSSLMIVKRSRHAAGRKSHVTAARSGTLARSDA